MLFALSFSELYFPDSQSFLLVQLPPLHHLLDAHSTLSFSFNQDKPVSSVLSVQCPQFGVRTLDLSFSYSRGVSRAQPSTTLVPYFSLVLSNLCARRMFSCKGKLTRETWVFLNVWRKNLVKYSFGGGAAMSVVSREKIDFKIEKGKIDFKSPFLYSSRSFAACSLNFHLRPTSGIILHHSTRGIATCSPNIPPATQASENSSFVFVRQ